MTTIDGHLECAMLPQRRQTSSELKTAPAGYDHQRVGALTRGRSAHASRLHPTS
jgi:hypothetical protein